MIKYHLPINVACVMGCIEEFCITKNIHLIFGTLDDPPPTFEKMSVFLNDGTPNQAASASGFFVAMMAVHHRDEEARGALPRYTLNST